MSLGEVFIVSIIGKLRYRATRGRAPGSGPVVVLAATVPVVLLIAAEDLTDLLLFRRI